MKVVLLMLALVIPLSVFAKVVGKSIDYKAGDVVLKGYLAYDTGLKGRVPGIIVVHEWWGLTEYPKMRARMLAKLGYVAFAADMFGNGKTVDNPTDAGNAAGESMKDPALLKAKFLAALDYLKQDEHVDSTKIGAIGYCYGGGVVLNMADAGVDLDGVASFHPGLGGVTLPKKGAVRGRILVCAGAADKFVAPEAITKFKDGMKDAGVDMKYIAYEGAVHAFTNPDATTYGKKFNIPLAYNKKADQESWSEMKKFFKVIFKS